MGLSRPIDSQMSSKWLCASTQLTLKHVQIHWSSLGFSHPSLLCLFGVTINKFLSVGYTILCAPGNQILSMQLTTKCFVCLFQNWCRHCAWTRCKFGKINALYNLGKHYAIVNEVSLIIFLFNAILWEKIATSEMWKWRARLFFPQPQLCSTFASFGCLGRMQALHLTSAIFKTFDALATVDIFKQKCGLLAQPNVHPMLVESMWLENIGTSPKVLYCSNLLIAESWSRRWL